MAAALWITEISSPFLHLRELLKELGYRDTDLNIAADVSNIVSSFLVFAFSFCGEPINTNKWVTLVDFR